MTLYLDSSALVKLVQVESESTSLQSFLWRQRRVRRTTNALARVEVIRAVRAGGPAAVRNARRQVNRCTQIALDRSLLDEAAMLRTDTPLRALDAIHLASAQSLGSRLTAVVTYDRRMQEAADELGMPTAAPA